MSHEIVRTRAGHVAVRSIAAGEVMHPGVGPRAEAEALYVRQSQLERRLRDGGERPAQDGGPAIVVFDVGLGAASNAIAAWALSESLPADAARLDLVSFERDLDAVRLALEHGEAFGLVGAAADAARALVATGEHATARTRWRLHHGDVLASLADLRADDGPDGPHAARADARADIVFWDPFSPRANPELWTVAAFATALACAGPRCTLFTYSASTTVRAAMLLAGWAVGIGDTVGDKAQTTAAARRVQDLARPLPRAWLGKLRQADVHWPSDAPPDSLARIEALPQFQA